MVGTLKILNPEYSSKYRIVSSCSDQRVPVSSYSGQMVPVSSCSGQTVPVSSCSG